MVYSSDWTERWNNIVDSYNQETDRAAAILAASFLEEFLKVCIQSFLIDDSSVKKFKGYTSIEDLFKGYAPLSTFSARTHIAFALGLMSEQVNRDLYYIRKVRNHFSHHPSDASFEDQDVKNWCSNLSTAQPIVREGITFKESNPKKQYLSAIGISIVKVHNIRMEEEQRLIPYKE